MGRFGIAEERKRPVFTPTPSASFYILFAAVAVAFIAFLFLAASTFLTKRQINKLQAEISTLKDVENVLVSLRQQKEKYQQILQEYQRLALQRQRATRLLTSLAEMKARGIVLQSLEFKRKSPELFSLSLQGYSVSYSDYLRFLDELRVSTQHRVREISVKKGQQNFYDFKIEIELTGQAQGGAQ